MGLSDFLHISSGQASAPASEDGLDEKKRVAENRNTLIFLVGFLVLCAAIALIAFGFFVWIIELCCGVILVAVFMFAYSIRDYSSDEASIAAGAGFLFAFAFSMAYFFMTVRSNSVDTRLTPPGLFLFVCAQWYQAFAYLIVVNRGRTTISLRRVTAICSLIALILISFHLFMGRLELVLATRFLALVRWANAAAFALFYASMIRRLRSTWDELPDFFATRTLVSILASGLACVGMIATIDSPPAAAFGFYFLRFLALSLCYNANVTFTLLSPYRSLFSQLTSRADQLSQTNLRLNDALAEKEVLLGEVHHRVKNNLQVISSLLSLQSFHNADAGLRIALGESQNRIRAMALVHEMLYQNKDFAAIDFPDYLKRVVNELANSAGRPEIRVATDCDSVQVPIDTAITCGLITNELFSNCLKHAFPEGRAGTVRISLKAAGGSCLRLAVEDDGVGFPEGFKRGGFHSMGLSLLEGLSSQLCGEYEISSSVGRGTRISVDFPKGSPAPGRLPDELAISPGP